MSHVCDNVRAVHNLCDLLLSHNANETGRHILDTFILSEPVEHAVDLGVLVQQARVLQVEHERPQVEREADRLRGGLRARHPMRLVDAAEDQVDIVWTFIFKKCTSVSPRVVSGCSSSRLDARRFRSVAHARVRVVPPRPAEALGLRPHEPDSR